MPATPTRPRLEQLRFSSSKTGTHNIDTYLENAEIGSRTIASLLSDLFDASNAGAFRTGIFQFRGNNGTLQFRIGSFSDANTGWTDLDLRTLNSQPALNTLPMTSTYPAQSLFLRGTKLYVTTTSISGIEDNTDFENAVAAGDINELFDAVDLSTSALDAAVTLAQNAQTAAENATTNNADFTALVARLTDIQNLANPAANRTALEAFGDSYAADNASNAITGLNNIGNTATAVTGLTNLKDSATPLGNLSNSATGIDRLGATSTRADAIDRLGQSDSRVAAIDALGDTTTSAAIDRLNQTDASNSPNTTADYIDALGTAAMVTRLIDLHTVISSIETLTNNSRPEKIDALNDRTTEIDALYGVRSQISTLGVADVVNNLSAVAQLSTSQIASIASQISPSNNIQTVATNASAIQDTADAVNNGTLVDKAIATDLDDILVVGPLLLS